LKGLLEELQRDRARRIIHIHMEEPRLPEPGPRVEEVFSPEIARALQARGIGRLFKFQAEAINRIRAGEDVLIVAGTGTGKTEAFLLPLIERVLEDPFRGLRALLVYPTKALARDQLGRIASYTAPFFGLRAEAYDGDVPDSKRRRIYDNPPQLLVTNPDMIHFSLMRSDDFKRIAAGVEYVVLDDAHVYSGVFGSHVHHVLRRLRRFTGDVQLVAASATIGNPEEFAGRLFGHKASVVLAPATRTSRVYHVLVSPKGRGRMAEAVSLLEACLRHGLKTLVFTDSHRSAELLRLAAARRGVKVEIHRAGLRHEERLRVEERLRKGVVDAVVSTPTLELGIDIGGLDAVIMYNLPPTFSRYLQRAGRVGRRGQEAYVFTILGDDPMGSFYERNPEEFFARGADPVLLDPWNEEVMKIHLVAMAMDSPYKASGLSEAERKVLQELLEEGLVRIGRSGAVRATRAGARYLRRRGGLRGVGETVTILVEQGGSIGERELPQALKELFPGAIGGRLYESMGLDLRRRRAVVRRLRLAEPPYLTYPLYYSLPSEGERQASGEAGYVPVSYLELTMFDVVYGYVVKSYPGMRQVGEELLEKEYSYVFRTKGLLLEFTPPPEWGEWECAEAFHAAEHALIFAAQVVVGAGQTDLGGVSFPSGHIYIYDSYPGGSGVSKALFERLEEAMKVALDMVSECSCEDGCPRCIYSPYCGNNNRVLSRRKASKVLKAALTARAYGPAPERSGKPIV